MAESGVVGRKPGILDARASVSWYPAVESRHSGIDIPNAECRAPDILRKISMTESGRLSRVMLAGQPSFGKGLLAGGF